MLDYPANNRGNDAKGARSEMGTPIVVNNNDRRRNQAIRTAIVFAVVIGFLALAFLRAYTYMRTDHGKPKASATPCPVNPKSNAAPPYTVTVNVFNATNRAGLAGEVAKAFKARGFVVGKVANDPLNAKISGAAEVRFGINGKKEAIAVTNQAEGAKRKQDKRKDTSIDFVIGTAFVSLKPAPNCTPATAPPEPSASASASPS